ncbi:MAG: NAD(+) synthase [archaeon]
MKKPNKIIIPEIDVVQVQREIEDFIIDTIINAGSTGGVIGLSGGVDSTTTAALAKSAFDRYNENNDNKLTLEGYILPSKINSPDDAKDGVAVARTLGINYQVLSIDQQIESYKITNPESISNKFHKGNLTSRIRANILHSKAAFGNKLVIGTGNKDEDFSLGYYTLFGDGAVHLSPIGNLSKRFVRQIAEHYGFENIANREPTAGLEAGQTDFKDLGYSYFFVEMLSEALKQGFKYKNIVASPQLNDVYKNDSNNYTKQYDKQKFKTIEDAIEDIYHRHESAMFKADIVHPPMAPVTLIYDGEKRKDKSEIKRKGYEPPIPTTDIIIEYKNGVKEGLVLIERNNPPYGLAIPGGFAERGITLEQNAIKEALEETGLSIDIETPERPLCVHSNPSRDPRNHMISATYIARGHGTIRAGDDAAKAALYSIPEVKELLKKDAFVFDHGRIIEKYLKHRGLYD